MSQKRKVLQGSASNLVRLFLSMLVSAVLPPFLVHRMVPAEYAAWVLILQLSGYVNLLDLGLQTAIGKFVAEYHAVENHDASHNIVSTSFTILAAAACIACIAVGVMVWSVPQLFHQMPAALIPNVRIALAAVGLTSALGLPFNTFASTFSGLQQYLFPTVLATVIRVGSAAALILLLLMGGNLVQLALVMAAFNVLNSAAQYLGWYKFARNRVGFSLLLFNREAAIRLAKYGSVLSIWTVTMFVIGGLDIVIVGHYQYKETGFYAIATGAANFMLTVVTSLFGPLVPAFSSMQATTTPKRIGDLCIKLTRYSTLLFCLLGAPLMLGSYPLLSLWVGRDYAAKSALYLQVLVIGNVVRHLSMPYLTAVVATGRQRAATLATVVEACANLGLSVWLVQRIGAVGVAAGTLIAAFISVAIHFFFSIRWTQETIAIDRTGLLMQGILRPMLVLLPSALLYPFWRPQTMLPAVPAVLALWAVATMAAAWYGVLNQDDRQEVGRFVSRLV